MGVVTLISVAAALVHLVGGWLALRLSAFQGQIEQVSALGAGFLLGTALLSMVPAAMEAPGGAAAVTVGFALFLLVRMLTGDPDGHEGPGMGSAWAALGGIGLHSLMEGVALGLAVQSAGAAGRIAVTGLLLHKVPEGVSVATLFLSATGSSRLAFLSLAMTALATVVGGWGGYLGGGAALTAGAPVLGIAAGGFLYVGAAELLPQVTKQRGSVWMLLAGMLLVYLMLGVGGHSHSH